MASRAVPVCVVAAFASIFATALVRCSLTVDTDGLTGATPADAATEAAAEDAGVDGCVPARWPSRPPPSSAATDAVEIVAALDSLDFGTGRDGGVPPTFGYDLDGVCTCASPTALSTCVAPDSGAPPCDLADGRDNNVALILDKFARASTAFQPAQTNAALRAGEFGLLVRVRGYNGLADDSSVEVALFGSAGTERDDAGVPKPPVGDGHDRWTVDPASLVGGTAPPYVPVAADTNAYVSQFKLVATVDFRIAVGVGTGVSVVDLKGSVVVGKLVKQAIGYRVEEGIVAGRWPTSKLLPSLEVFPDPLDPSRFLCGDSPAYPIVKDLVCSARDIVSDVKQDNTGAPCDAVSVGIEFSAAPAELGAVLTPPPRAKPCGPQWADDCAP